MAVVLLVFSSAVSFMLSLTWVLVTEGSFLSFMLIYSVGGNAIFATLMVSGRLVRQIKAALRPRAQLLRPEFD